MLYISYQAHLIFLHLRFQKMQERNTKNQKKHTMPHVCGRKSFSRKRNDIVSNIHSYDIKLVYYTNFVYEDNQNRKNSMSSRVFY